MQPPQWHSTCSAIQCCWRGSQHSGHTDQNAAQLEAYVSESINFPVGPVHEINSILHPLKGSICDCGNLSIKLKEMKAYTIKIKV
jgi:hypothetical protein